MAHNASVSQAGFDSLAEDVKIIQMPNGMLNEISLAYFLAWYDVRHRYTRSVIGPFWITLQTAIFAACIGFVFAAISNASIQEFLPYFAVSFILWTFFAGAINDSTTTLAGAGGFIKDRGLPAYIFFVQCFFRHLLFLGHNAIVPLALFLIYGGATWTGFVMAIPGFFVFAAVTLCASLCVGAVATRYRDAKPIVESVVNLAFLASPIMWKPHVIGGRDYLLDYNPIVHLLAIWREPLLDGKMAWHSFAISLAMLAALMGLSWIALKRLRAAAFWI